MCRFNNNSNKTAATAKKSVVMEPRPKAKLNEPCRGQA